MCLAVMGTGAFAMDMAVGGGLMYNWSKTSGTMSDYDPYLGNYDIDWSMNRNGFGVFGFFGFSQYAEANLGFLYKNPGTLSVKVLGYEESASASEYGIESTSALQLGLYGKYPIPISDVFVFFPTVGLDLELTLSGDDEWWHDLWFRGGVGLDYFLSERMFVRGHLIYGAALPLGGDKELGLSFTHGLLIKAGLGFML